MTWFFAALDALIHPARREKAIPDELRSLRLIGGVTAWMLLQVTLFMAVAWPLPVKSVVCCGLIAVALCSVLVRLRATGSSRGAPTLLWLSVLLICAYAALHRGAQWSLMGPLLCVVVLLAMFLSGPREALAAFAVSAALVAAVVAVHETGNALPAMMPEGESLILTAFNAVLALAGATFLAWLNHSSRQRAYQELATSLQQLKESEAARERAETELRLAQKLESVGRLASGVAHEINTPVQFVDDSVAFIEEAFNDVSAMTKRYRALEASLAKGAVTPGQLEELEKARAQYDVDYALEEGPQALRRAKDGLERITKIVRSMRDFAHPDATQPEDIDLNRAIESTLTIASGEYKNVATVETSLADLPPVRCIAGELNQVILNLVVNASHAIADRNKEANRGRGHITVKTWAESDTVVIAIGDDGCGIPAEVQPRIFDPFFTTKELGRGTGQGLALARAVVVKRHGGSLTFETKVGEGTTFFVRLPMPGPAAMPAAA